MWLITLAAWQIAKSEAELLAETVRLKIGRDMTRTLWRTMENSGVLEGVIPPGVGAMITGAGQGYAGNSQVYSFAASLFMWAVSTMNARR